MEHVCEGAKDVQKAIMGGPKAMQEVRLVVPTILICCHGLTLWSERFACIHLRTSNHVQWHNHPQAVGVLVKSSAGKLRELCPSIDRGQIQDIITDVVGAALGGDSMPAKAFKKARCVMTKRYGDPSGARAWATARVCLGLN